MRKTFELPAIKVVEVKKQDMICTSTGNVSATMNGTFTEQTINAPQRIFNNRGIDNKIW